MSLSSERWSSRELPMVCGTTRPMLPWPGMSTSNLDACPFSSATYITKRFQQSKYVAASCGLDCEELSPCSLSEYLMSVLTPWCKCALLHLAPHKLAVVFPSCLGQVLSPAFCELRCPPLRVPDHGGVPEGGSVAEAEFHCLTTSVGQFAAF